MLSAHQSLSASRSVCPASLFRRYARTGSFFCFTVVQPAAAQSQAKLFTFAINSNSSRSAPGTSRASVGSVAPARQPFLPTSGSTQRSQPSSHIAHGNPQHSLVAASTNNRAATDNNSSGNTKRYSVVAGSTMSSTRSRPRSGRRSRGGVAIDEEAALAAVRRHAISAPGPEAFTRAVLDRIPPTARLVLLGEASHGTKEFYDQRAELTQLLIRERGFTAVVVESDWPDAFRVNRYVRDLPPREDGSRSQAVKDRSALEALGDYKRFPRWMWHNQSVAAFVEWLHTHNASVLPGASSATDPRAAAARTGFYGMDVYSLHGSAEAVLEYLRRTDPQAARVVEARYRCFDRYGADAQSYGLATSVFHKASCEESVQRALYDIRRRIESYRAVPDGPGSHEDALEVEANAMVVSGAEAYYRNMFTRDELTWNLRDTHFFETVQLVERHLARLQGLAEREAEGERQRQGGKGEAKAGEADVQHRRAPAGHGEEEEEGGGGGGGGQREEQPPAAVQQQQQAPKLVLWAHNSHLGDARHTDSSWRRGQLNIGQLVRQAYGDEVCLLGFSTHTGFVTAADDWGEAAQHKTVKPSLPGSYEHLLHRACQEAAAQEGPASPAATRFALDLRTPELAERLEGPLLERAIGVVYRPDTELQSHYFEAVLPRQFDLLVHVERSRAVQPLEPEDEWAQEGGLETTHGDMPEAYPTGV